MTGETIAIPVAHLPRVYACMVLGVACGGCTSQHTQSVSEAPCRKETMPFSNPGWVSAGVRRVGAYHPQRRSTRQAHVATKASSTLCLAWQASFKVWQEAAPGQELRRVRVCADSRHVPSHPRNITPKNTCPHCVRLLTSSQLSSQAHQFVPNASVQQSSSQSSLQPPVHTPLPLARTVYLWRHTARASRWRARGRGFKRGYS